MCKILNYYKLYPFTDKIGNTEKHHIIPKSWEVSLSKNSDNIVSLPIRVHFIIHRLMVLSFPTDKPMTLALWRMANSQKYRILNSKEYNKLRNYQRVIVSEKMKGRVSPTKGMKMPRSPEHSAKISKSKKGCSVSSEQRKKISEAFRNKIWITDGNVSKRIKSSDRIPDGWKRGRGEQSIETKRKRTEEVRERVSNGSHHLLGTLSAFNITTQEIKRIPKKEFYSNPDIWVTTFQKHKYITC